MTAIRIRSCSTSLTTNIQITNPRRSSSGMTYRWYATDFAHKANPIDTKTKNATTRLSNSLAGRQSRKPGNRADIINKRASANEISEVLLTPNVD